MTVDKNKQVNISLSEEAKANITFDEFQKVFGKHFIGKAETAEQAYERLTGRYARIGDSKVGGTRPGGSFPKSRKRGGE